MRLIDGMKWKIRHRNSILEKLDVNLTEDTDILYLSNDLVHNLGLFLYDFWIRVVQSDIEPQILPRRQPLLVIEPDPDQIDRSHVLDHLIYASLD
jgi:hypothetical protein